MKMTDPASGGTSSRSLNVMFGLVVLVAVVLLTRSWHASLLDRYEFRQLQTALSSYWRTRSPACHWNRRDA